jgi:hypothetical protein
MTPSIAWGSFSHLLIAIVGRCREHAPALAHPRDTGHDRSTKSSSGAAFVFQIAADLYPVSYTYARGIAVAWILDHGF